MKAMRKIYRSAYYEKRRVYCVVYCKLLGKVRLGMDSFLDKNWVESGLSFPLVQETVSALGTGIRTQRLTFKNYNF